jgi:hypothetical protein
MTRLQANKGASQLVLSVLVCAALACLTPARGTQTSTQPPEASPSAPATTPPQATDAVSLETPSPAATEAEGQDQITAQGDVPLGPGNVDFPAPAAGLSDLTAYTATLTLSFEGTEAAQPSEWSKTYVMISLQAPLARELTITSAGLTAEPEPLYLAERDGASFEKRGEQACTAGVIEAGQSLSELMEPAGFLTGVLGADAAGSEMVNGVAANHYTFDERALGEAGVAQSTGELWVAADGGYLVKYVAVTHGGPDYFGEGIEGTLNWDYALTAANAMPAIELPSDCPAGLLDAPALPDAAGLVNVPGLLSYTTASSPAEVMAFYQAALPGLGWQPNDNAVVVDDMALQDFTRQGQQLALTLVAGEAGTDVLLTVGPVQP